MREIRLGDTVKVVRIGYDEATDSEPPSGHGFNIGALLIVQDIDEEGTYECSLTTNEAIMFWLYEYEIELVIALLEEQFLITRPKRALRI